MDRLLPILEDRLRTLPLGNDPSNLYEPIRYVLSLGGKRLRPMLVLLSYGLFKGNIKRIINLTLAVEIFHNFTLIHDDIMDLAPQRRGKSTVHEKWNNTTAILSGDTMLIKAYDLLMETPPDLLKEAICKFNKCAIQVCEGQQIDMNFEKKTAVTEHQYINMIRLKTAVLLGFSMEFGGLLAGRNEVEQSQLQQIGELVGIGFQIMDDWLDVYANQAKFGKQMGGDIISNKKTFLLIKALELANKSQKKELDKWLNSNNFDLAEKINAVKSIYEELGIERLTQDTLNEYYDRAFSLLNHLDTRAKGKAALVAFLQKLMKRER